MRAMTTLMAILFIALPAYALTVENLVVAPNDVWLGDPVNISAACTNNATPVTRAYVDIAGQGLILPSLDMTGAGSYALAVPGNYFDRKGTFTATVNCMESGGNASGSAGFTISTLSSSISVPQYAYSDDVMEIAFTPKKNDAPITSDITFTVMIDSQVTSTVMPPIYDTQKGWLLRVAAPQDARTYGVSVNAVYQGKSISASSTTEVRKAIDFQITNLEKISLKAGENITLDIKATNRGVDIPVTTANLFVRIGGTTANIVGIAKSGVYNVRFTAPDLSPGIYQLTADLNYNGTTYSQLRSVTYAAAFSTGFADDSGAVIIGQIKFLKSGLLITEVNSKIDGTYSAQIVPDTYDVEIDAEDVMINLQGANVNTFTSPLNITKSTKQVEGFVASGFYNIKVGWSFSSAIVKLRYDTSSLEDINSIYVFKCNDWNYEKNKCNSFWTKIKPEINSGFAVFSVSDFSVFAAGSEEKIKASITLDKQRYPRKNIINIRGSTSGFNKQIPNASVRIKIDGAYVDHTVNSNSNGVFSLDFLSPDAEGNYTLNITAKKAPYLSYSGTQQIEIISMPSLSIVFPGSIKTEKGNRTQEGVLLVNKGQKDITNIILKVNLEGKYFTLGEYKNTLKPGEEMRIPISFFAYADDEVTTKSASLTVESSELKEEKVFGFTITEKAPENNKITGFAVSMPSLDGETTYTIIFAILAFSAALLLKRVKNYVSVTSTRQFFNNTPPNFATQQSDAAAYLNDVKSYLKGKGV